MSFFIKTFLRYKIDEDFGTQNSLESIEKMELNIKDKQHAINKKEHDKDKKETKTEVDAMRKDLGTAKDEYKKNLRDIKVNIGNELFNRFMKGFVRGTNAEDNEKITHSEFLFKKLNF
jgi:hypothetical protein